jgi:hypothetical protein
MSLRDTSPTDIVVPVVGLLVVVGAAVFAAREWQADCDVRAELATVASMDVATADLSDAAARLDAEDARLAHEADMLRKQIDEARGRQMPLDDAATQQARLSLLTLAARCGMHVVEINQIDDVSRAVALVLGRDASTKATKESTEAFLRRFSGPAPRPLVKLIAAAEYPAVHRFMAEMSLLPWNATPAYFALDPGHETTTAEDELDIPGTVVDHRVRSDGRLVLTLILAL